MKDERRLSKEVLERIAGEQPSGWGAGQQVLEVKIQYRKDGRPRGYYLNISIYRDLDDGGQLHSLFSDPYKNFLIQETKAFSRKTFESLVVPADVIERNVNAVKAQYLTKRREEEAARAVAV